PQPRAEAGAVGPDHPGSRRGVERQPGECLDYLRGDPRRRFPRRRRGPPPTRSKVGRCLATEAELRRSFPREHESTKERTRQKCWFRVLRSFVLSCSSDELVT